MKNLRALAAVMVVALTLLAIWVAWPTSRPVSAVASKDAAGSAYDYEARDVVVQQMGPDGTLQYELEARHITQLPHNGQISATELVMHYDPPGTIPGGKNRWTLSANSGDLPVDGKTITLDGKVRAQGLPVNASGAALLTTEHLSYNLANQDLSSASPSVFTWGSNDAPRSKSQGTKVLATEQITYNIATQEVSSPSQVLFTWGRDNSLQGKGLRANIKSGDLALQSEVDVTLKP